MTFSSSKLPPSDSEVSWSSFFSSYFLEKINLSTHAQNVLEASDFWWCLLKESFHGWQKLWFVLLSGGSCCDENDTIKAMDRDIWPNTWTVLASSPLMIWHTAVHQNRSTKVISAILFLMMMMRVVVCIKQAFTFTTILIVKKNRFQHCFKAAWRSPIKIHCEKSLSTTSNYCLSSSLFQSYYIVIILAIFSWNVLHFVFLRFLPPRIFLFVPLFIFHICRLTCAIFFTKFPTSNWSQCAAICIVVHTTTFPTKYCTEYSTHSSTDFYKIFYGSGPMHCNEESDRCISRPSDNGHL